MSSSCSGLAALGAATYSAPARSGGASTGTVSSIVAHDDTPMQIVFGLRDGCPLESSVPKVSKKKKKSSQVTQLRHDYYSRVEQMWQREHLWRQESFPPDR